MSTITLSRPQYTLTLTPNALALIHNQLSELPAKVSRELLEQIEAQITAQEQASAQMELVTPDLEPLSAVN